MLNLTNLLEEQYISPLLSKDSIKNLLYEYRIIISFLLMFMFILLSPLSKEGEIGLISDKWVFIIFLGIVIMGILTAGIIRKIKQNNLKSILEKKLEKTENISGLSIKYYNTNNYSGYYILIKVLIKENIYQYRLSKSMPVDLKMMNILRFPEFQYTDYDKVTKKSDKALIIWLKDKYNIDIGKSVSVIYYDNKYILKNPLYTKNS